MIPMNECIHGHLYRINSRNLNLGVYREDLQGFIGIREKFGPEDRFLFTEFHSEIGAPHGTVHPQEDLGPCPVENLMEGKSSEGRWQGNKELFAWLNGDGSDMIHRLILGQCYREAVNSPDRSTQIGAVIVGNNFSVKGSTLSHNGFTRGWVPTEEDFERPRKYNLIEHAERRAVYRAAKAGIALEGCTLYSSWAACQDCARAIVESGIIKLVRHYPPQDEAVDRWLESVQLGDEILKAAGVEVVDIHGSIPDAFKVLRGGELYDPSI